MSQLTLRERALSKCLPLEEIIEVPGLGDADAPFRILMRGCSGSLRSKLLGKLARHRDDEVDVAMALLEDAPELILECAFDVETKEPVFLEGDLAVLAGMDIRDQRTLALTALRLSRIGIDAETEAGKA